MPASKNHEELRAVVSFLSPETHKSPFKLKKAGTIFGRENGDVILKDQGISATHCQIQYIDGQYVLFDMNSSNGTRVNGKKIIRHQLASGEVITIGGVSFKFTLERASDVDHISTILQGSDDYAPGEKTSIVDNLLEQQSRQTRQWEISIAVTYQDGSAEEYRIPQSNVFIGRATSFGRFEEDSGISRRHLLIRLNDHGEVFVEDEGSTNGSYLNGCKIQGIHLVNPNDEITIGSCRIKIQSFLKAT